MALPKMAATTGFHSLVCANSFVLGQVAWHYRPVFFLSAPSLQRRSLSSSSSRSDGQRSSASPDSSQSTSTSFRDSKESPQPTVSSQDSANFSLPPGWEDSARGYDNIKQFSDLPHRFFGYNQHIKINEDFKESLRQILWQFRAPIRYAFAYGSGVFSQSASGSKTLLGGEGMSPHPNPPKAVEEWQKGGAKIIDFIFGVSHTQHWHSLNLGQHPDHYSGLKYLPYSSAAISMIQDRLGAGVYFNPFITVNGVMIKYGVVNLDTIVADLSEWQTLYLAGRLQKPVKILRDDPRVRLANQHNLLAALRTALLMLPEKFTERQLYERIAGLSYMGDPRMLKIPGLGAGENLSKVSNIVGAQLPGFRQLYVPLIENLPNVQFTDSRTPHDIAWEKEDAIRHTGSNVELAEDVLGGADGLELTQDMDPHKRGNMVRRLPRQFRSKVYYKYKTEFGIPGSAFDDILTSSGTSPTSSKSGAENTESFGRREAGEFEERIAAQENLPEAMGQCVSKTVSWPATSQTMKSFFTAGVGKAWRYYAEKRKKGKRRVREEEHEENVEEGKLDGGKEKKE